MRKGYVLQSTKEALNFVERRYAPEYAEFAFHALVYIAPGWRS
jgi:hypothetical protein